MEQNQLGDEDAVEQNKLVGWRRSNRVKVWGRGRKSNSIEI